MIKYKLISIWEHVIWTVYETVSDFLYNTYVFSNVWDSDFNRSEVRTYGEAITPVLIRNLKWEQDAESIESICSVAERLGWINVRCHNNRNFRCPLASELFQWLYHDTVVNENVVGLMIESMTQFHSLPVIRTDKEVHDIIRDAMWKISSDSARGELDLLEKYLPSDVILFEFGE